MSNSYSTNVSPNTTKGVHDDTDSLDSMHDYQFSELNQVRHFDPNELQEELENAASRVLSRTSTIISNIKEDNRFAKTQVVPNPSFDIKFPEKIGTSKEPERNLNKEEDEQSDELEVDPEAKADAENATNEHETYTGEYNKYDIDNKPPDGGFWAWTCAICVMLMNTFSWGANAAFGVYLNYYSSSNYFPGATMEQYVMIGGLSLGLSFMICAFTNPLCRRFHYKYVMIFGVALIFLCYWLASISKNVIQLIMFQGFLMAFGYACVAGSTFVILPTWFLKKRSIAQGIATAGGGLGGIIFSRPIDEIIKRYLDNPKYVNDQREAVKLGIEWSLRMQALVSGFFLLVSVFLLRTYRPIGDNKSKDHSVLREITAFLTRKDLFVQLPMISLIVWNMVFGLAYAILLFSLSSYATSINLTYAQGSNVTTVQSVAQTVFRPIAGLLSDKIGRANVTLIFTVLMAILVFFFWIFVTTYSELIAFAFLIGSLLGVNWVNFGPMTADIVGGGGIDLNHAMSIQMFVGGIPYLFAELVGLKLKRSNMKKQFLYCQILVGLACIISAVALIPFREWKVRRILSARRVLIKRELEKTVFDNKEVAKIIGDTQSTNSEEVQRLDKLLDHSVKAYCIRSLYPIVV